MASSNQDQAVNSPEEASGAEYWNTWKKVEENWETWNFYWKAQTEEH